MRVSRRRCQRAGSHGELVRSGESHGGAWFTAGRKGTSHADWLPSCRPLCVRSKTPQGDIYYFNFGTGESIWDHPCDEHYRCGAALAACTHGGMHQSGIIPDALTAPLCPLVHAGSCMPMKKRHFSSASSRWVVVQVVAWQ